jgi:hypothetical protein
MNLFHFSFSELGEELAKEFIEEVKSTFISNSLNILWGNYSTLF